MMISGMPCVLEDVLDRDDRRGSYEENAPSSRASQTRAAELRQRERDAREAAAAATLPHVRAAHERAAATWRALAERRERTLGEYA